MNSGFEIALSQTPVPNLTRFERMGIWVDEQIHDHPTTIKILKIAGLISGIGLLVSLPFTAPILGIGIVVGLAITGVLLTLASSVALLVLDLFFSPGHDMKNHVFKPQKCEGGELYYEGDVPILSLDSGDPRRAGKAHGYLCGDAIHRLTKRFGLALHTLGGQPRASQIPRVLAEMRKVIPPRYLDEMEGLVEGYNQWVQEQPRWRFLKKLIVDDVLLLHLMPDSHHFNAESLERQLAAPSSDRQKGAPPSGRKAVVACSAIVDKDPKKGMVFARNMDWPSCGLAGAYSLVIHRKAADGLRSTVEVGMPGFIGTLTGMNDQGLSLAMNVCAGDTEKIGGMPAALYNRACLERCASVEDVEEFTHGQSPFGAYHLTVADQNHAESIHFYQEPLNGGLTIRQWAPNKPLSTLNCRYNPMRTKEADDDLLRQQSLDKFFRVGRRPLEDALSLPFVNNSMTTHRVVMEPETRTFRVAFDNAFAGKSPLLSVPTQELFT